MRNVFVKLLFGFGFSFFLGYVVVAVGLGSLWPALYKVAAPIVCSDNQQLQVDQKSQSWRKGATMVTAEVACVDPATGQSADRTSLTKLVAGAVYSLVLFVLFLPRLLRKKARPGAASAPGAPGGGPKK